MVVARGETPWLAVYAPLSWLFMLGIAAMAVFWLGQLSLALGRHPGLAVFRVQENQINVRGHVQFVSSQFAHAHHDHFLGGA